MAGYVFSLFAAVALPVAAGIFLAARKKTGKALLLGAACFLVFQVFTRLPLLQVLLPRSAGFVLFQSSRPVLYLALLALSAGIFEECGRFLTMRLFLKNGGFWEGLAFGAGHGGVEAILLVGLNLLLLPLASPQGAGAYPAPAYWLSGLERLFAMAAHICWSLMIWRSLQKRTLLLPAAVLLHGLFDFIPALLLHFGLGAVAAEGAIALMTGLLILFTRLVCRSGVKTAKRL